MSQPERVLHSRADAFVQAVLDDPRCCRVTDLLVTTPAGPVVSHSTTGGAAQDLFSVTRTLLALLTGIAVGAGRVRLDQPIAAGSGTRTFAEQLTVEHLLTLTRGAATGSRFDLDEVAVTSANWADAFVAAPQEHRPGERFSYDNGASQLLADLLHRTVPGGLAEFGRRQLFDPLGFGKVTWLADPSGTPCGATGLQLSAVQLDAVGRLLLDAGRVDGRPIVPAAWVARMRQPSSPGGPPEHRPYGMGLWLEDDGAFFGAGWAGQLLYCRPADGLVLVTLTDPEFTFGPPARDRMPTDWVAPLEHARRHVLG